MPLLRTIGYSLLVYVSIALAVTEDKTLVLIDNDRSDYVIVLPAQATPPLQQAAAELQQFLWEMTGVRLAIASDASPVTAHEILLGGTNRLSLLGVNIPWHDLGEEGYVLKTVGAYLLIAGSDKRGTLYGVYGLLEDHLGCRWFTPTVRTIPKTRRLMVPSLDEKRIPVLEYREPFVYDCFDGDWCCRNRMNSSTGRLEEKHGGKVRFGDGMFVHTFNTLLPPGEYFAKHPEYFSEIDGRRQGEFSQLCCTNDSVQEIVTRNVLAAIRRDPQAFVFSVSQNDWAQYCQCRRCQALAEKEGSQAGPLLLLVNHVAERVENEFPGKAIETLAYQWSRKPPRTIRPRANVIIRLCSIECSFSEPLTGSFPANQAFAEDLEGWAQVSDRLWIWDYTTSFSHYLTPFPNLRILDDNIRFFIRNNVRGIFEEDNYQSPGGELSPLAGYMMAKFLWNPEYDENAAMNEFLQAVYGPAARPIRQYIDLLHDRAEKDTAHLTIGAGPFETFLSAELLHKADMLWQKAEASVAEDAEKWQRVRTGRMSLDYVFLERARAMGQGLFKIDHKRYRLTPDRTFVARASRFQETAAKTGLTHVREGGANYAGWKSQLDSLMRLDKVTDLIPKPALQPGPLQPGLEFIYLERSFERIPDFARESAVKTGVADEIDLRYAGRPVDFAMKFSGYIRVPVNGIYCFSMRSNDGARLYIGDDLVVDNEHLYGVRESCGYAALQAGFYPITVTFFQQQGGRLLDLFWQGPKMERRPIPANALFHSQERR